MDCKPMRRRHRNFTFSSPLRPTSKLVKMIIPIILNSTQFVGLYFRVQKISVISNSILVKEARWLQVTLVICGLFICDFAYMRSKNDLFFWNISSNYQSSLVFLYANSLYASLFLESLSLAYNEVQPKIKPSNQVKPIPG